MNSNNQDSAKEGSRLTRATSSNDQTTTGRKGTRGGRPIGEEKVGQAPPGTSELGEEKVGQQAPLGASELGEEKVGQQAPLGTSELGEEKVGQQAPPGTSKLGEDNSLGTSEDGDGQARSGTTTPGSASRRRRSNSRTSTSATTPTPHTTPSLNETSQPMNITIFAAATPTVLEAEEDDVQARETEEGDGNVREGAEEGEEGNGAIAERTPMNQAKRLRPATGNSGNSEEQVRKADNKSALESRRSEGGILQQSTFPMSTLASEFEDQQEEKEQASTFSIAIQQPSVHQTDSHEEGISRIGTKRSTDNPANVLLSGNSELGEDQSRHGRLGRTVGKGALPPHLEKQRPGVRLKITTTDNRKEVI